MKCAPAHHPNAGGKFCTSTCRSHKRHARCADDLMMRRRDCDDDEMCIKHQPRARSHALRPPSSRQRATGALIHHFHCQHDERDERAPECIQMLPNRCERAQCIGFGGVTRVQRGWSVDCVWVWLAESDMCHTRELTIIMHVAIHARLCPFFDRLSA